MDWLQYLIPLVVIVVYVVSHIFSAYQEQQQKQQSRPPKPYAPPPPVLPNADESNNEGEVRADRQRDLDRRMRDGQRQRQAAEPIVLQLAEEKPVLLAEVPRAVPRLEQAVAKALPVKAVESYAAKPLLGAIPMLAPFMMAPKRSTAAVLQVALLLKNPQTAAAAVLLKEILDRPLSRRPRQS